MKVSINGVEADVLRKGVVSLCVETGDYYNTGRDKPFSIVLIDADWSYE